MSEERVERRLAAILCADVAGYSRLMGEDEEGTLAALKAHRRELLDPVMAAHQGRLVKTTGDGMLIEFFSVVDAVRGAVAVQEEMERRNASVPEERRIRFRIGINLGDIIVDEDDIFGDGVNVAARLEALAEPGTICISSAVREQLGERLDVAYADLGEHAVKNIARPIRVYRIGGGVAAAPPAAAAAPRADRATIAVLPFANMSGDPEQEYFADGMVEDIITGLSHIKWLAVTARNSSFVFKGKAIDVKRAARELGVRYILEGSVRKAGNRVRITAQLIAADEDSHLWAERFDGDLTDVFALQDEITLAVVGAIEPSVRAAEIERVRRKRPNNFDAHDLFLRALPHVMATAPENATEAIPLLERALALDPRLAAAHGMLALCHQIRFIVGGQNAADRDAALAHARAALTEGGDDAAALASGGFVAFLLGRDTAAALEAFERAIAINPSSVMALSFSALALAFSGKTGLAIERAERALKLSPFDPLLFGAHAALAAAHLVAGRPDEAVAAARRAIQVNPRFPLAHAWHVMALVSAGRVEDAKAAAQRLLEVEPSFTIAGFSAVVPDRTTATAAALLGQAGLPA